MRILNNPFSRAPEQKTSETSISVRTDYDEIDRQLLGHIYYFFGRIPDSQHRLDLQTFGQNRFGNERELGSGFGVSRFQIGLNLIVFDIKALIKGGWIFRQLKNMQYIHAGAREIGKLRRIFDRLL